MSPLKGSQAGRILSYLREGQPFCSIQASGDWLRSTRIREGNLLYSVYQFKC